MVQYLWIAYALFTAVMWGLGYAITEKVIKDMLPASFFALAYASISLMLYIGLCVYLGTLKTGFDSLLQAPKSALWVFIVSVTFVLGFVSVLHAFELKNATAVNLIEVSYPAFTFLFAWLLFRDVQINLAQLAGGLLIFSGVGLIMWKS